MLLVDHHQAQLGERHVFLNHGLRADDQRHRSVGNAGQRVAPLAGVQGAGEQESIDSAVSERFVDRLPMLVGEHLGRRHEDGLMTGGDRHQNRVESDGRFARADLGLQQAMHGFARLQVARDLRDGSTLSLGEGEREQPADPRVDLGRRRQHGGGAAGLPAPPPHRQPELKLEQVVEDQAATARFELGHRLWQMQLADRLFQSAHSQPLAQLGRQRIGNEFDELLDGRPHDLSQQVLRQSLGQPVEGQHLAAGLCVGVADQLGSRMRKFPAARVPLGLAGKEDRLADLELVHHPGLIEPEPADVEAVAVDQHADQVAAVARHATVAIDDGPPHGLQLARAELAGPTDIRQVEHVARQVPEQVFDCDQVQVGQQPCPIGPYAFEELYRCLERRICVHGSDGGAIIVGRSVRRAFWKPPHYAAGSRFCIHCLTANRNQSRLVPENC